MAHCTVMRLPTGPQPQQLVSMAPRFRPHSPVLWVTSHNALPLNSALTDSPERTGPTSRAVRWQPRCASECSCRKSAMCSARFSSNEYLLLTRTVCGGVGRTVAAVPQSPATETVTAVCPSSGTPCVREHCGVSQKDAQSPVSEWHRSVTHSTAGGAPLQWTTAQRRSGHSLHYTREVR